MKEAKPTLLQFAKMTVAERKALPLAEYGELIADWTELGELLRSNPGHVALVRPSDRKPRPFQVLGPGAKSAAGSDAFRFDRGVNDLYHPGAVGLAFTVPVVDNAFDPGHPNQTAFASCYSKAGSW